MLRYRRAVARGDGWISGGFNSAGMHGNNVPNNDWTCLCGGDGGGVRCEEEEEEEGWRGSVRGHFDGSQHSGAADCWS